MFVHEERLSVADALVIIDLTANKDFDHWAGWVTVKCQEKMVKMQVQHT